MTFNIGDRVELTDGSFWSYSTIRVDGVPCPFRDGIVADIQLDAISSDPWYTVLWGNSRYTMYHRTADLRLSALNITAPEDDSDATSTAADAVAHQGRLPA